MLYDDHMSATSATTSPAPLSKKHQAEPLGETSLADDWAPLFYMLGDPTRLRLLIAMHHHGAATCSVGDLADAAGVNFKTASKALRLLALGGIVKAVPDGRRTLYGLADDRVHDLVHRLGGTHAHD